MERNVCNHAKSIGLISIANAVGIQSVVTLLAASLPTTSGRIAAGKTFPGTLADFFTQEIAKRRKSENAKRGRCERVGKPVRWCAHFAPSSATQPRADGESNRAAQPTHRCRRCSFRQTAGNALCHRDRAIPGSAVGVAMYDDQLEILNTHPAGFLPATSRQIAVGQVSPGISCALVPDLLPEQSEHVEHIEGFGQSVAQEPAADDRARPAHAAKAVDTTHQAGSSADADAAGPSGQSWQEFHHQIGKCCKVLIIREKSVEAMFHGSRKMQRVGQSIVVRSSNHGCSIMDCCGQWNRGEMRSEEESVVVQQQGSSACT